MAGSHAAGSGYSIDGNVYIITGASKGFGFAMCESLLQRGACIAMLARNAAPLEEAREQLSARYGEGKLYAGVCDVANGEQVGNVFRAVKQHFGQLNGVVCNAGLARPGNVEALREEEVVLQVNTNFVGTVLCCKEAIPLLRGENNPRIVTISSASAWHYDEMLHLSIYAASKAAVERFTRDLRLECQNDGIGVTCVRPGAAWTSFADGWDEQRLAAGVQEWSERFGGLADAGMEVGHVAETVSFALAHPAGVAIDLLEVRPNRLDAKTLRK